MLRKEIDGEQEKPLILRVYWKVEREERKNRIWENQNEKDGVERDRCKCHTLLLP